MIPKPYLFKMSTLLARHLPIHIVQNQEEYMTTRVPSAYPGGEKILDVNSTIYSFFYVLPKCNTKGKKVFIVLFSIANYFISYLNKNIYDRQVNT